MLEDNINKCVADSISFYNIEKVSDMTKEQLSQIISKSIYTTIISSDFIDTISNKLALRVKRRMG